MEGLTVFVAQAAFICLKGLQQINVVKQRYIASVVISIGLGVCGLLTTAIIAKTVVVGGHWSTYAAFIGGGPVGILAAMYIEKRMESRK